MEFAPQFKLQSEIEQPNKDGITPYHLYYGLIGDDWQISLGHLLIEIDRKILGVDHVHQ